MSQTKQQTHLQFHSSGNHGNHMAARADLEEGSAGLLAGLSALGRQLYQLSTIGRVKI